MHDTRLSPRAHGQGQIGPVTIGGRGQCSNALQWPGRVVGKHDPPPRDADSHYDQRHADPKPMSQPIAILHVVMLCNPIAMVLSLGTLPRSNCVCKGLAGI